MNKIIQPPQIPLLVADRPGRLILAVTDGRERGRVTELVAELAARGCLQVIAGSDWVPGYGLARALRRRTVDLGEALERVRLGRSFTCYQLLDLLETANPGPAPLLVLDFLHGFYDDDLPYAVRVHVLKECCGQLRRLSRRGPVGVIVQQTPTDDFGHFLPFLAEIADELRMPPQAEIQPASQQRLF